MDGSLFGYLSTKAYALIVGIDGLDVASIGDAFVVFQHVLVVRLFGHFSVCHSPQHNTREAYVDR